MTNMEPPERPEPPVAAGEAPTLLGFLDYQRVTLAWKCSGLDPAGLQATVGASTMTLGGLLKHLACVEEYWFSQLLAGQEEVAPWNSVDWDDDPDWEWRSAAQDSPEQLMALWQQSVDRSRELTAAALADHDLSDPAKTAWKDGRKPSFRWILVHMIEEYARHNGHADLLRESVDGSTGE